MKHANQLRGRWRHLKRLYEDADFTAPQFGRDLIRAFRKKVAFLQDAASELDLRAYKALHYEKLVGNRIWPTLHPTTTNGASILRVEADEVGRILIIIEIIDYHR